VVVGRHSGMDISTIFENNEKDFLSGKEITDGNFDFDDIYYIQELGYTTRGSLVEVGFNRIENKNKSIYDDINEADLK
jgi:hypothetical protein